MPEPAPTPTPVTLSAYTDGRIVYLVGKVTGEMRDVCEALERLALTSREPIHLHISSGGGAVTGGHMVMDQIRRCQVLGTPIHGLVLGHAESMAAQILQACDERVIGPHTLIMVHGCSGGPGDGADEDALNASTDLRNLTHEQMARTLAARTAPVGGRTCRQWRTLLRRNTPVYFTAAEAVAEGLADRIL